MENEIMNLESSQFTGDYVKDIKNILKEAQRQSYRAFKEASKNCNF